MADPEVMAAFVANQGERPTKPKAKNRQRAANSTLPAKSENQERLDKKWADIRFAFLMCQLRSGNYHCHECGLVVPFPRYLDLDHIEKRNKNNYTADNAQLLCNRLSTNGNENCHDAKHRNFPEWSRADESPGRTV